MTMTRDCSARPGWCQAGRKSTIAPSRQEQHREERMKVTKLETLRCGAGWRNYNFLKLSTDEGIVGWSEFDEGFGSPGVGTVIEQLAGRVIGRPVSAHEHIHAELYCATRPAAGGVVTDLDGVKAIGREVREKGFGALKTNLFSYQDGKPQGWRPGFGRPFYPELNVDKIVLRNLRMHLEALDDGAGPDVDLLLDLNFNAKTEGYLKILRTLADFDMFWIEIDSYSAEALGYIRRKSPHPISSCETLFGIREFLPYFREQAIDVAIIDTVWNGVWQSMKIAATAEANEVNVAPHNFYGHLCTMMNAHFAAAVPNLRIMEIDVDRLPWDHELFTQVPRIEHGHLVVPDTPGWGTEPNEEALRAHPPTDEGGLIGRVTP